jgi:hypothetical protein
MNLEVEYKDQHGVISTQTHRMTRLAFAKHMAIAGQGYAPTPQKLLRTIAMFFHYSYYVQRHAFYNDHFSEPPIQLSDPTEKGQFSNLAGKAIADFLSKRIDSSLYTVNYEAAMRLRSMPINVGRPDLIAFTQNSMFAMEAKGFTGGHGDMNTHKVQSTTGGIPVNFTVACISYDLYNKAKCKYHDPYNDNVPFDDVTFRALTRNYYSGLSGFLDQKFFEYNEVKIQNESFYEIELSRRNFDKFLPDEFPFHPIWHHELLWHLRPKLILPGNLRDFAESGLSNDMKPFSFESTKDNNYLYVDNDRVGLKIRT